MLSTLIIHPVMATLSQIMSGYDEALFRDQVLPALPREIQAHIDEEEYLATKIRLLEFLERCLLKSAADEAPP